MSIKSDKWIRRMAEAHGMIEPYEAGQVREVDGKRIVSYGTSSYGYDIRASTDFKIFTNINSTIVDPKAFDPKSFVDFSGPVCIIPPNSFALARTVEYFRIPRNVLTVCLGKCVTGDTRVVDAETGAYLPITEFAWGRSTLAMIDWRLRPAKISAFTVQGTKPVFELRTASGHRIKATANHPFRQLHGWTPLENLKVGDRIAVARSIPVFGKTLMPDWEASLLGLMISEGSCRARGSSPVFTSTDPVLVELLQDCVAKSGFGEVSRNGRMGYRLVNHHGRGGIPVRNRVQQWLTLLGQDVLSEGKFVPQCVFMAPEASVRLFLQALFSGDGSVYQGGTGYFLEYYSKSRRLIEDVHQLLLRFGIFSRMHEKTTAIGTQAHTLRVTDIEQIGRFSEYIGFCPGSDKQRRLEEAILPSMREREAARRSNFDPLPPEAWPMLRAAVAGSDTSLNRLGVATNPTQSVPYWKVGRIAEATKDAGLAALVNGPLWDVIESIEPAGEEPTYDLTVPGPHNFLANGIVVHNSTYARCFSGDTRVALVDGTSSSLEEMARRHEAGEVFWGYSIGPNGRLIVTLLDAPRFIGRDALLELELDNREVIRATPDHLFMRRDGLMAAAANLRPGDSLMPLYPELRRGDEMVYQPLSGRLFPTHRLADEWNVRNGIYADPPGTHRHHIDFDRRNNRPTNLERMAVREHLRMHNAETYGPDFDREAHSAAIRDSLADRALEPQWRKHFSEVQAERANHFWQDERYEAIRRRLIEARGNPAEATRDAMRTAALARYGSPAERRRHSELMRGAWARDDGRRRRAQAEFARQVNLRPEITAERVRAALDETGSIRGAARLLECDRSVFRRFPDLIAHFRGTSGSYRNHQVTRIRELPGEHDVYCLTVPEAGNFALQAGVFVRNCGIIVNVTPFEPEWEGYVTLEFSNTTPLPAKIYANEGVAQVIFFESDEVCETSYRDRGGKYQGQKGVTLPKM